MRISDWSSDVCLFEHLATELREILIHVGRYAQRSTQRCHIALPSRLATMEPQRSNLIEFERIARSEAQPRLPIKNGIAFGFLDELADRKSSRLNSSH